MKPSCGSSVCIGVLDWFVEVQSLEPFGVLAMQNSISALPMPRRRSLVLICNISMKGERKKLRVSATYPAGALWSPIAT